MKRSCEELGVCQTINCKPCAESDAKRKEAAMAATSVINRWIPNSRQQSAYSAAGVPK